MKLPAVLGNHLTALADVLSWRFSCRLCGLEGCDAKSLRLDDSAQLRYLGGQGAVVGWRVGLLGLHLVVWIVPPGAAPGLIGSRFWRPFGRDPLED
jgi:hypothetical protein